MNDSYNYYSHIELNFKNKINTWGIFWYATVFFNEGLSLHPMESFVRNIGHDNSGINCGESADFNVDLANSYQNSFPVEINVNDRVNKHLAIYYKGLLKPFYKRVLLKIKNKMKVLIS